MLLTSNWTSLGIDKKNKRFTAGLNFSYLKTNVKVDFSRHLRK